MILTDIQKNPRKILIIGASGFLGTALYHFLKNKENGSYLVFGTYNKNFHYGLEFLDVTNPIDLKKCLINNHPDYIIYTAGNKDVNACEMDYKSAYAINAKPIESITTLLNVCKGLSTRLLYISTDYVFDGINGYYIDTDLPNPKTLYGLSKYSAEKILKNSGISYKIIRTGALMGKGGVFFDWIIHQIKNKTVITMYDNVFFTPTPIYFFCEMVYKIIDNYEILYNNVIHIAGEQRLSRFSFSFIIKELLKSDVVINSEHKPEASLIPHDLSLISSDVINAWRNRNLIQYLSDELII